MVCGPRLLISILRQVCCNQLYSTSIEQVKWGGGGVIGGDILLMGVRVVVLG